MTGLSRAQTSRLISMYLRGEEVKLQPYRRRRFAQRYTRADIALLAGVDEVHGTLSGPAARELLERACYDFDDALYQRLAGISVAQLYRLRGSRLYRERHIAYQATRPTAGKQGRASRASRDSHQLTRFRKFGKPASLRAKGTHFRMSAGLQEGKVAAHSKK
jgi:hypothetical protein